MSSYKNKEFILKQLLRREQFVLFLWYIYLQSTSGSTDRSWYPKGLHGGGSCTENGTRTGAKLGSVWRKPVFDDVNSLVDWMLEMTS